MENSKKMTLWERTIGIFINPGCVFEDLKQHKSIVFPFLLLLLAQPIFYIIRYPAYVKFMGEYTGISNPNDLQQMVISGIIIRGVWLVAVWIISSLIMFGFSKILRQQGTFKQILSTNGYAYIVIIPMLIIMSIVGQFTGDLLINFSPAVFVPHLKGTALYGVLRFFCIFFVWQQILMGVGYYKVTKMSKPKVIFIIAVTLVIQFFVNFEGLKYL